MSFKSSLKLDSKFFKPAERKSAFKAVPYGSAQWFRRNLQQKMEDSVPAGRVESIGENTGFETRFRRSRRGQRPAIQTRKLISSIYTYRRGESSASTEVTAENEFGENIGELLQEKLGRQVMTDEDINEARLMFNKLAQQALAKLLE